MLIDTGDDDFEELLLEKSENVVNQKLENENQYRKIFKNFGLMLVQLCRQILHIPITIFEYFKMRFDRSFISLS